jgi:glycosyltransferase involved in cell wall biosynthesis
MRFSNTVSGIGIKSTCPMISIIITSYNRATLVIEAIESALSFIDEVGQGEIIIVDDHSTDETVASIGAKYQLYLDNGRIKLIQHALNLGVTAAKNSGAGIVTGQWIMFLDSDDKLQPGVAVRMTEIVQRAPESCPVIFFRCIDEIGQLIGPGQSADIWLQLPEFLRQGTPGECLPVVGRSHFLRFNYDEDLRGFEGLTYGKMINAFGPVLVSPVVARVYRTDNSDRLSTSKNIRKRGCLIALGYVRTLCLFSRALGFKGFIQTVGKVMVHFMRCLYSKTTS